MTAPEQLVLVGAVFHESERVAEPDSDPLIACEQQADAFIANDEPGAPSR